MEVIEKMKIASLLSVILGTFVYAYDVNLTSPAENCELNYVHNKKTSGLAIRIDACGPRSVLGPAGKNICADTTGVNIAVEYNDYSGRPGKFAYLTPQGIRLFGPFGSLVARSYGGIDGRFNFGPLSDPIWGSWHEPYQRGGGYVDSSAQYVAFDESGFPNGRWWWVRRMPQSGNPAHNMWLTCIGVQPDNPNIVYTTGVDYDFPAGGGKDIFGWRSTDGGYNWLNPILIVSGSATIGAHDAPHFRFGTGGYVFAYFQRDTVVGPDTLLWPYYIESTNGGITWIPANGKCFFTPSNPPPYPRYSLWWYNYDCEVIDNTPYVVLSPGIPWEHRDRIEFWKGSGPVGNRAWALTLLGGTTAPGIDSIVREVSIASGKDIPRFDKSIAITANISCSTSTDTRLWISKDLGQSWEYRGKLHIYASPEMAHILSRHENLTSAIAHFVFEHANSIYYEWKEIPNFTSGIHETESVGPIAAGRLMILQNPTRTAVRLQPAPSSGARPGIADGSCRKLKIYDVSGKLVKDLSPSIVSGQWTMITLIPGIYFVRLEVENEVITKKVVVIE